MEYLTFNQFSRKDNVNCTSRWVKVVMWSLSTVTFRVTVHRYYTILKVVVKGIHICICIYIYVYVYTYIL
jgi:hypothetical protein